MRWLVPVAAIAVVTVTSVVLLRPSHEPDLLANAGGGPAIYRSQEIEVVGPAGESEQAPKTLQWKAFGGATGYKVQIIEVDHTSLWSAETGDTVLTIPSVVRAKMMPGKPLLWQVTGFDRQGKVLAISQLQRFSVVRKSPGANE